MAEPIISNIILFIPYPGQRITTLHHT
uniref:Uncharacterized protein n=1 Tax=Anguilla anguilla TaxID=7936 RepID=A0A0E9UZH5_ANGAN